MIQPIFKLLLFLLFFLSLKEVRATDDPAIKYIGIEQGLSNNSVLSIYQDYKGLMWFGTYDGLNRYDGYNFTVFRNRIGDSTSINSNEIYNITGDKNRTIWVGSRRGINRYDPVKNIFSVVKYYPFGSKKVRLITGSSSSIVADSLGFVFTATDKDGLVVFDNKSDIGVQVPLEWNGKITSNYRLSVIELDWQGHGAWLFVRGVGLCRYVTGTNCIHLVNASIPDGNCLNDDGKGKLWCGTDNGLFLYDIATNTFSDNYSPFDYKISCISIDKKGDVWVGSDGKGVMLLNRKLI